MQIKLADHYGICFGVRDALQQAHELAGRAPLTILGELVHNPIARDRLAREGVREARLNEPQSVRTRQVMITAHGASEQDRSRWRGAGFEVADGTCPLVRRAHSQLAALVREGFFPVVIGKRGHVEVLGLTGDFPNTFVLEHAEQLRELPECDRYGVISQTTQISERASALVTALRRARPESEVCFRDTICQPTKDRQSALRKLVAEVDTLVVVGGRNSNNTLQLVAAATKEGLRVFHVERAEELEACWFTESESVGLTAGTSTLEETVQSVHGWLVALAEQRIKEEAR
jgi:4-hydroxy-3-methylbut-2-enyl diphosphate reductase